jgi:hypothetical protein
MKTINKVIKIDNNQGNIHEIIEFNGKKFKIMAELRNGGSSLGAEIMDSDGIFHFVLGRLDVNFEYTASYVSEKNRKEADMETGINAIKNVIKKVYS